MRKTTEMFTFSAVTLLVMTSLCEALRVIDLTYQLKEGENVAWPIYPRYNFTILDRGFNAATGITWLEANLFNMAEHTGTHLDAPAHFAKDHWRTQQIPPSRLVGPAVVIDVTEKVKNNPDYLITVEDMMDWESQNGEIPSGGVVLMKSGWGSRYPSREQVFNTENVEEPSTFHFPGYSSEAARWLADERDIIALGVDTPSPDPGHNGFPVHEILLGKDILILENVAHLDRMPLTGATVVMGVLNIYDGSGGPMRLLALLDPVCSTSGTNGSWKLQPSPVSLAAAVVAAAILGVVLKDRRC